MEIEHRIYLKVISRTKAIQTDPIEWKNRVNQDDLSRAQYKISRITGWNETSGLLTRHGQDQLYELGQRLKEIYIDGWNLLPQKFNNSNILIGSTLYSRTVLSAKALFSG